MDTGDQDVSEEFARDRDKDVAERPLSPLSLVGSYFRGTLDGELEVEGLVVGQPFATSQTSIYLVEIYGRGGPHGYQKLVDIESMLAQGWLFFDSEAWLSGSAEIPLELQQGKGTDDNG